MDVTPADGRSVVRVLSRRDVDDAVQRVVDQHEPLFRAILRKMHVLPGDYPDALQGARLGFLEAMTGFDPLRGATIGSYARGFIVKRVLEAVFRSPRKGDAPPPLPTAIDTIPPSVEAAEEIGFDLIERMVDGASVRAFLANLPQNQRDIAIKIGIEGARLTDVAAERGVSPSAVGKVWKKVVKSARATRRQTA